MATPVRYFQSGGYYHIYNRGNRKQDIYLNSKDYLRFFERTEEYAKKFDITILCYCLMPNHFHFLAKQNSESITKFMLRLSTSYAKYFNTKYDQVGSLFQGRFKAKIVETDEYLLQLSRYIHRNPFKLCSTRGVELRDYRWSSYPYYLNLSSTKFVDSAIILDYFSKNSPTVDYKSFVEFDSGSDDSEGFD